MMEVDIFIALALVGAGAVLGAAVAIRLGFRRNDRPASDSVHDSLPVELTGTSGADREVSTAAARITISLLPCDPPENDEPYSAAAHLVIMLLPDQPEDPPGSAE